MELQMPGKRPKTLPAVRPSFQTEDAYREALDKAVRLMLRSYRYWLSSRYREAQEANADAGLIPDLAQDAKPKSKLNRLFRELDVLSRRWEDYFAQLANRLVPSTLTKMYKANATGWSGDLRRAGFDIGMQLTKPQSLILDVANRENVSLIKSIPQQFHTQVEGVVSRGFLAGRDLDGISKELVKHEGITTRRAALIARDQSNKLTADMNAARQNQLGIRWAVWKHSSAGKEPRPNHVRAGREGWIFDTQVGIDFGDGFGYVLPGKAINCRCVSRSIIPAAGRGMVNGKQFDADKLEAIPGFPGAYRLKD